MWIRTSEVIGAIEKDHLVALVINGSPISLLPVELRVFDAGFAVEFELKEHCQNDFVATEAKHTCEKNIYQKAELNPRNNTSLLRCDHRVMTPVTANIDSCFKSLLIPSQIRLTHETIKDRKDSI